MTPPQLFFNPLGPQIGGVSYSLAVILFLIIEGLAYFLASSYFIYRFAWKGRRLTIDIFKGFERGVIDKVYHEIIPRGVDIAVRKTFDDFEVSVLDSMYNEKLVSAILSIGELFDKTQTEKINHYLIAFMLGIILFLAVLMGVLL
ncbi:hypothetical protein AKJ40_01205 [candidate division MSBL1 archaeon SCGC-AAA259M10]|uniref:Uncharacterized protein n=2 Tax=candidate division MSBL1 TaxID=215777 RepID=A0A133U6M4_9EURY|nr:hypothetical protein AKJ61_02045 [candidate division MSBL1 archaeon SCGC-AAA259B11]KXB00521.1 hypothetical protein AKJ40_01205 [candidate division MSBL1 archaeon SCGC-AAA259M10]